MEFSYEPIDVNKYGIHTSNYLLKQAKKNKINISKILKKLEIYKDKLKQTHSSSKNNPLRQHSEYLPECRSVKSSQDINSAHNDDNPEINNNNYNHNIFTPESDIKPKEQFQQNKKVSQSSHLNIEDSNIIEDNRWIIVLNKLGLSELTHIFFNNHITFNDFLFLSPEDWSELNFHIYQKNRIIAFIKEYTMESQDYTIDEIQIFFDRNKKFDNLDRWDNPNLSGNSWRISSSV